MTKIYIHDYLSSLNLKAANNENIPKSRFFINHEKSSKLCNWVNPGAIMTTPNQPAERLVNNSEMISSLFFVNKFLTISLYCMVY